ncbi:MAG: biosynthetic arginine decarboxylase [Synechococcus sp. SB0668_bin_13]|nr:biosynthetic arginine decarboxylase [Cyanobacteria bacterium MAG IRC4_bin_6]MXW13241.1 biosynthetic arginine decarboxylase [Synechococcus sp. SB0668_bin_13]MXX09283.1 biosynthetic arginine decarboxylase [Synechococcus sp. SB0667_bin_8]MYG65022.1 biosynthetic arginine decarboxylase [Synechococcus sp. SB0675_bin_7]
MHPTPRQSSTDQSNWTAAQSSRLYGLNAWGRPYFSISEQGHVMVRPRAEQGDCLDLVSLVQGLQARNLSLPLLIRFDDILEDRLASLHDAFGRAIAQYNYQGRYQGVFPIKCHQQRHVLEHVVRVGRRWNFGLEAGSKAELLIALALLDNPDALLICNGYKDTRYLETAILARRLGRRPLVVIEQASEVDDLTACSRQLGMAPLMGVRAKLSVQGIGRWGSSSGDGAKFGLSAPDLLATVNTLREVGLLGELRLLHMHIGSQISDIAVLKEALQEMGQLYVQLAALGAPMGYLDVGGGLGVDYDGSCTATPASTNYSLQNYANDVVATIQECCQSHGVPMPTLVSESGRAVASHFSVLVFDVLNTGGVNGTVPPLQEGEPLLVRNLRELLATVTSENLQEAWHDAVKFKDDALSAFRLGYLSLVDRAKAEQLYWACCRTIAAHLGHQNQPIPADLQPITTALAATYYANFSIFRSAPDTWAIDQLFPVMPIHRLHEPPQVLGTLADLTCDSDGKLNRFIDSGSHKSHLELHHLQPASSYWMGLFLGGAYQEIMGNLHNLFGRTNAVHIRLAPQGGYQVEQVVRGNTTSDVLTALDHDPQSLVERLRRDSEAAIGAGNLTISDAHRLLTHVEESLRQSTYLESGVKSP